MRIAVAIAILFTCSAARAACPPIPGGNPSLGDLDDRERLRFVRSVLRSEERAADAWTWAWAGVGVAFTGAGIAVAATADDEGARTEATYGAVTSALLPLFVFVLPMEARAGIAEDARDDTCAALAKAEARLEKVADDEALRTSGYAHGFSIGSSVLLALPLGLVWDRWRGFALNAASSELVGIAQIGSTPTSAVHVLRRYRNGILSDAPGPRWNVSALGGAWGLSLTIVP